jgi:1-acyl-sn-glycerol-3-phosphate acyltransferase
MPDRPVLIVANHPSWWDPLVALILTGDMPAGRLHYAPIEAVGLAQYPFLSKVGFFGFDRRTAEGAARFLRTSVAILGRPESVLWVTAQGEFVDPRERPTTLKGGIGHVAHRLTGAIIVPLGIEYPFWNDRCPEILIRFGRPIEVGEGRDRSPREWTSAIERSLQDVMDALAIEAVGRDPDAFRIVIEGTAGVGGVYDTWRRTRAWFGGRSFQAEHATGPPTGGVTRPLDT